jgi:signal transduction histidine kinase
MTGEEQSRAFDAFWTTRPDGSGLGLASVRNTLRRLGGSVSLESEVGQGTRVRMAWPADADVAVAS